MLGAGHKGNRSLQFSFPHIPRCGIFIEWTFGQWTFPFSFLNFYTPRCSLFIQWTFGRWTLQFSFLHIPRWVYFHNYKGDNNKHGGEHQQMQKPNVQCPYVQCVHRKIIFNHNGISAILGIRKTNIVVLLKRVEQFDAGPRTAATHFAAIIVACTTSSESVNLGCPL